MVDTNMMHSPEFVTTHSLSHLLIEHNLLTPENGLRAEQLAHSNNIPLVSCLVRNNFVSSDDIFTACSNHFKLPAADLSRFNAELIHDATIATEMIDRYHVFPLHKDANSLQIAMSDPTDHAAIAAIRFHTGLRILPLLAKEKDLDRIIHTYCRPNILYSQLKNALARMEVRYQNEKIRDDHAEHDEPVIQFVNQILEDAVKKQVSDIHIETFFSHCRIRFRLDGLLYETASLPPALATRVVTRLKIMANLDIAEKRIPQDGRFSFQHQKHSIDIRANTCPALHGENIVLRLLRHSSQQLPIDELGMTTQQLIDFQQVLQQPQGLILVTGPTGSGKTATLYSALQLLNQPDKNILTVEDPVEIELPGITQVAVNPRIGLDFAVILRAFLRQDPDIIMVGEIRDAETAAIAVQSAQTGHLVISTLHTNNAVDSIKRLLTLNVSPCQLAGSLKLIAAQRLVRKRCHHCHRTTTPSTAEITCEHCRLGYLGRTGIYEVIPISSAISKLLLAEADLDAVEAQFEQEQHLSLYAAGLEKIQTGITDTIELRRVTGVRAHDQAHQ